MQTALMILLVLLGTLTLSAVVAGAVYQAIETWRTILGHKLIAPVVPAGASLA